METEADQTVTRSDLTENLHPVSSGGTDEGQVICSGKFDRLCGRGCLAGEHRNAGIDCFHRHVSRDSSTGIDHAFLKADLMPESIADHFVKCVMPSNVLAGKKNLIFVGKETAVGGEGNTVKRHPVSKGICHMEDPFRFPLDWGDRNRRMFRSKIIIQDMIAGAAGRGGLYERGVFPGLDCLVLSEIDSGAFAVLADVDLLDIVDGLNDMFRQKTAKDELCEMLWEADQFHGKPVVEIDTYQMFVENLFFSGKNFTFPADKLIALCFQ